MEHANITVTSLNNPLERQKVPICTECGSVFINKKSCEACGFQFLLNRLGEPLDERSFYFLQEQYWNNRNSLVRHFRQYSSRDDKKARKYLRALRKRYDVLLKYFFDSLDKDRTRRRLFLFELQDLVKEMAFFNANPNELAYPVMEQEAHPLAPAIAGYIEDAFVDNARKNEKSQSIWDRRFFGVLRYGFMIKLGAALAMVVYTGLAYYKSMMS